MLLKITGKCKKILFSCLKTNYKIILIDINGKSLKIKGKIDDFNLNDTFTFYGNFKDDIKYGKQFDFIKYEKIIDLSFFVLKLSQIYTNKNNIIKIMDYYNHNIFKILNENNEFNNLKYKEIFEELKIISDKSPKNSFLLKLFEFSAYNLILDIEKIDNKIINNILNENIYELLFYINNKETEKLDLIAKKYYKKHFDNRTPYVFYSILKKISIEEKKILFNNDEIDLFIKKYNLLEAKNNIINIMINKRIIVKVNEYYIFSEYYEKIKFIIKEIERIKSNTIKKNDLYNLDVNFINKKIKHIEKKLNIIFTEKQYNAISLSIINTILMINGSAGTGKTTLIKGIVEIHRLLLNYNNNDILLLTPTGKAANRIMEVTNIYSSTIHSYLCLPDDYLINKRKFNKKIISPKLIIIDECSMVDINLIYIFLRNVKNINKIIFIGDRYQLPPVEIGNFYEELYISNFIKTINLNKVIRQDEGTKLISICNLVKNSEITDQYFEKTNDYAFIDCNTEKFYLVLEKIIDFLINKKNKKINDIQILSPMYEGEIGINNINNFIRKKYIKKNIEYINKNFDLSIGDKVIQTKNIKDLNVYNGDIGIVEKINKYNNEIEIFINFSNKIIKYKSKNIKYLQYAHCISIHKAQGSEFNIVILPIFDEYKKMLNKNLLYTAVTRAKKKLYIIGNKNIFFNIFKNTKESNNISIFQLLNDKINISYALKMNILGEELNGLEPKDM